MATSTRTVLIRALMALWIIALGVFLFVVQPILAQSQDTINERNRAAIDTISREVDGLRQQNLETRIRVLEDTVFEVKLVGRTAIGILFGQLLLEIAAVRRKRSGVATP